MEVREALQNGTVYRRRGDSREAITGATFTRFENWCAAVFSSFAVQHFTFTAAPTAGADRSLAFTSVTDCRYNLCYLCPLLPIRWPNGSRAAGPVWRFTPWVRNLAGNLLAGCSAGTIAAVTCYAGCCRTGVISEGKLCQHLHAPSEMSTSCFAHILRCSIHRIPRER